MTAFAVVVKLWADGLVQLTFQLPTTADIKETPSIVFCTVCGFGDRELQSGGRLSVSVVSTFVGPNGPLLCRVALALTANGLPAFAEGGPFITTLATLMSD